MKKRFPVWPHPYKLESLSSWIMRIADYYRINVDTLFEIGFLLQKPSSWWDIDVSPSAELLNKISINTGLSLKYLNEMTVAGISPWVIDSIKPVYDFEFTRLTTSFCILNSNSPYFNTNSNCKKSLLPWMPNVPWKSTRINRFCPICIENKDLDLPNLLVWRTVLVSSCLRHECLLVETKNNSWDQLSWKENIISTKYLNTWLDEITLNAIETGFAKLGNEKINVSIWVRFLRSLFHELTIESRDFKDQERINEIWRYAGLKKPRNKIFELLEIKERANVTKCAAYLLQDFPRQIISFIPISRNINQIFLPNFIAKYFGQNEIYYDLFLKEENSKIEMTYNNRKGESFLPAAKLFVSLIQNKINKHDKSVEKRNIIGAEYLSNLKENNIFARDGENTNFCKMD
ncbi:TniQ family protein [Pigmentibacter sp. JX0631]|uniref:TniQ family protein n=1 Tax=Pigmentibacter sp. JX0631 TaxID=2976982 RepID=UPI00246840F1|nr:TniQ family protein [Pigmentibacter sp. JX0631]WGL59428.1 TniQ family protein [Pigmentibacter sp. JX0631]